MLNAKKNIIAVISIVLTLFVFKSIFFESEKEIKCIYLITKSSESYFWKTVLSGAETAAREYNVELVVMAPDSEDDYATQNMMIESAIIKKADAIIFSACDYNKSVEYAEAAVDSKISFIVIDSDINTEKKSAFIGTDNTEASQKAAKSLIDLIEGDAKIGIVSSEAGGDVSIQRTKGFSDYIKTLKGSTILQTVYSKSNIQSPYEMTKQMILENKELNAIFTVNEWTTLGVARAISELGLKDKITVVGFDNNIESIKMLENHVVDSLVVQNPFAMGYLGVKTAIESVENKFEVGGKTNTGTVIINRENIFSVENEKIVFPFSYKN